MPFPRTLVLAAAMAVCCAGPVGAATFVVDTTVDAVDVNPGDGVCDTGSGACALRAAVQETNALAGPDDVTLPAGLYTLTIYGASEDLGASGDLDVHDTLTITGAGASSTTISGNDRVRVIEAGVPSLASPLPTLTLAALRIFGGAVEPFDDCNGLIALAGGDGVCANTFGLTITDAIVESSGNGILAVGSLELVRSTVQLNSGVGVRTVAAHALIRESAIHHNGIGIQPDPSAGATIRNTTLFYNIPVGIDVSGGCEPPQIPCPTNGLLLENVTMVAHSSYAIDNRLTVYPSGGTAFVPVTVRNSLIVGNTHACAGELTSAGYNLIDLGTQQFFQCAIAGDPTGNIFVDATPPVEDLDMNGGPTPTVALLGGNAAINAGNPAAPGSGGNACPATDQRGVARPVGGRCDIGAFESSCGDGVLDADEVCETGVCCNVRCGADDGLCPTCLACEDGTSCGEPPLTCEAPISGKSTLRLGDKGDPAKRGVGWQWRGEAVSLPGDFGQPASPAGPGYELCLYAGGPPVVLLDAAPGCNGGLCWSQEKRGVALKSDATVLGKIRVLLKAGRSGAPDILAVKTKGALFDFPSLPLSLPIRVRLARTDTGACWDATYEFGVRSNTPTKLNAKSNL